MITPEQKRMLEYNDDQIKNYKKYKAIELKKQENKEKQAIQRREDLKDRLQKIRSKKPKTFMLYDRTVIIEKDLTEDVIERQIEFWEMLGRYK